MKSLSPGSCDFAAGLSKHKGVFTGAAGHSAGGRDIFPLPRLKCNDSLFRAVCNRVSCESPQTGATFFRDVDRTLKSLNSMANADGRRPELAAANPMQVDVVARVTNLV